MLTFDSIALLHTQKIIKKMLTFRGQILTLGIFTYCSYYNHKSDIQHHFRFMSRCDIKGTVQKYQVQYQCYKKKDDVESKWCWMSLLSNYTFYRVCIFLQNVGRLVLVFVMLPFLLSLFFLEAWVIVMSRHGYFRKTPEVKESCGSITANKTN